MGFIPPATSRTWNRAAKRAAWLAALCLLCALAPAGAVVVVVRAQQPNPVDRKVTNPITDTPNVNPLEQNQPIRPRQRPTAGAAGVAGDELDIRAERQSVTGEKDAHVFLYEGNVDARVGIYRLQADKLTYYEATQKLIAEGSVVFDQGELQRITGSRAEFNARTKLGFFVNSTGFTNQTEDGTVIYFTADSVEKVSPSKVVIINGTITACDEETPKWSFTAKRAEITLNDRVRAKRPAFRVKGVPVVPLPYVSVSIKRRDRASGFLTPTFSGSGKKGFRLSNAYYQTLGRSADVTLRNDIFTKRGLGFGADVRTMANSRSFLYFGFYMVKDRIFGAKAGPENPDQGGTSFYADGVHYFPNGFVAAVDVNITSNLAFRQIFSDDVQRAISPEERSQVFVNKNAGAYSYNFLARTQVTTIPNARIRIRQMPSVQFDRRPSPLDFFKKLPVYFSFESGFEGLSRKETVEDLTTFRQTGSLNPIITPSLVQRLRVRPQISVPFNFRGWTATATGKLDGMYYSNSLDPLTRIVVGRDLTRLYGEFEFDVRPPALARNFYKPDGSLRFRHLVEPYVVYRKIEGVGNPERVIRFDYLDAVADTNEIEFGLTNRFFTRRSTENVSGRAPAANGTKAGAEASPLTSQPYEALSITVRGKYFFDQFFGGALLPGRRNQFYPVNSFSGFTYGGVPRRFSPLNVEARIRPNATLTADVRTNIDVSSFGVRDLAVSFGLSRRLVQAFTTFYYTRAVSLAPSLQQFADPLTGREAGTLKGAQWSPAVFVGTPDRGLFVGASTFFDFQNRPGKKSPLVSTTFTLGYTWDCCNLTVQDLFYNLGLRKENRVVFSFRLNGIGTFGTEQFGQHFR
ncbi:MAG: LPS assembly protein LptD [Acidobacteria bacterium]|nr:LPS assembly protein LptD [Acidobacteriota bacterium]MCA1642797.1 LPS assembly protein LptD [Acidobacteriota bacterium]